VLGEGVRRRRVRSSLLDRRGGREGESRHGIELRYSERGKEKRAICRNRGLILRRERSNVRRGCGVSLRPSFDKISLSPGVEILVRGGGEWVIGEKLASI